MSRASGGYLTGLSISSLASNDEDLPEKVDEFNSVSMPADNDSPVQAPASRFAARDLHYSTDEGTNCGCEDAKMIFQDQPHFLNLEVRKKAGLNMLLKVPHINSNDVLVLTAYCLPIYISGENLRVPGVDFFPLTMKLLPQQTQEKLHRRNKKMTNNISSRSQNSSIFMKTALSNGLYSAVVTSASGLRTGHYVVNIKGEGGESDLSDDDYDDLLFSPSIEHTVRNQLIRFCWKIVPAVKAAVLDTNITVQGFVHLNEYAYYRCVLTDTSKLLSICCKNIKKTSGSSLGDIELYVSDRFDGLVSADRENCVWKCCDTYQCTIDILPGDIQLAHYLPSPMESHVRCFMIGICGSQELTSFELCATVDVVPPCRELHVEGRDRVQILPLSSYTLFQYNYHSFNVNQSQDLNISCCIVMDRKGILPASYHATRQVIDQFQINSDFTDGVYVSELLLPFSDEVKEEPRDSDNGIFEFTPDYEIVMYISATAKFPNHRNYTWKAFGKNRAAFVLDASTWKYLGPRCYFSVYVSSSSGSLFGERILHDLYLAGIDPTALVADPSDKSLARVLGEKTDQCCSLTLTLLSQSKASDSYQMSTKDSMRLNLFHDIFGNVDGTHLSHKDRSDNTLTIDIDECSLAYGEVNFEGFGHFLAACGAVDGQVFYDLGSGVGKGIVAAALSGICFLKCIGIEILPSLVNTSVHLVRPLMQLQDHGNEYFYNNAQQSSARQLALLRDDSTLSLPPVDCGSSQLKDLTNIELCERLRIARIALPLLEIRSGNFLDSDWSDGDFVFVAATCFSENMLCSLFDRASTLSIGAHLIIARLPEISYDRQMWLHERTLSCDMSWGKTYYNVLRRIAPSM